MSEFHLFKYPITSVEGNEYAVSIYEARYSADLVKVSLYKKVRGIFGREKFKCLTDSGNFAPCYDEKKWNYDYIAMAKNEVVLYEKSLREKVEHENKRKTAINKFEQWKGREEDA